MKGESIRSYFKNIALMTLNGLEWGRKAAEPVSTSKTYTVYPFRAILLNILNGTKRLLNLNMTDLAICR